MPRPRTRTRDQVVTAARDVFWEHGYEGTAVSDLERRAGVNRSSLYAEFGSKQALFSDALDLYYEEIVDPLIGRLESDANVTAVATFFEGVKSIILEEEAPSRRGCLLVNTIAELAAGDPAAARRGAEFRDRLARAFHGALQRGGGQLDEASTRRRAEMLLASALGVWLCARIDQLDAAARCTTIVEEVRTWFPS
jgi:TetR/AcrR family transcriptional regulator, transcriptional repressor for nem operon